MPRINVNSWNVFDPPPQREKCAATGKAMFSDRDEAAAEAERIREKDGLALETYRCEHCDQWHFTSQASF